MRRFNHNMQQLFHLFPKPIKANQDALRHPDEIEDDHMKWYYEGDKEKRFPRMELKQIRHDFIAWGERGMDYVVSLFSVHSFHFYCSLVILP